jgi:hypothetical protein
MAMMAGELEAIADKVTSTYKRSGDQAAKSECRRLNEELSSRNIRIHFRGGLNRRYLSFAFYNIKPALKLRELVRFCRGH